MNKSAVQRENKTLILVLLCFGWFINTFDRIAINIAVIPISKEFGLTDIQVGLVVSSFFLSYAIMQPIGGILTDRFGSQKVILFSVISWSIFTIITGMSWSFLSLIAFRFLFGIGEGSFPVASQVYIAETFPKKERARSNSLLLSAGKVGAVLSTLIITGLINLFNWKLMFVILGFAGLLLALFYWKHFNFSGKQMGTKKEHSKKMSFRQALKIPMLWQLTVIYFGISIVSWGSQSWMPSYLSKVRHLDLLSVGALEVIPKVFGLIAILVSGWLLDKYLVGRERYLIIIGSTIGIISMYFFIQAPSITYVILFSTLANIGVCLALTTTLTMPLKYIDASSMGTATGMVYFGGQLAGVIAPTAMGFMIQQFNGSYNAGFWFLIVSLGVSLLVGMTVRTHSDDKNKLEIELNS